MDRLPVAIVSVYPYVNAVVAVTLGWIFYREPFGLRETAAMVIIFAGVAAVKRYSQKPSAQTDAAITRSSAEDRRSRNTSA
jgi:drug/metabolite transporter (DMT)-like permease